MQHLLRWVASVVALYITVYLAQLINVAHLSPFGPIQMHVRAGIDGFLHVFIVVAVLAIVNAVIRPILELIALPITCLTLGLFTIVINAILFWFVGSLHLGLEVVGFWAALYGSIVMGLFSGILGSIVSTSTQRPKQQQ
jgi:putative membrane protein